MFFLNKAGLLICLAFFIFYFGLGALIFVSFGTPNNTNDFAFHLGKASGSFSPELAEVYSESTFENYPFLFHFIFSQLAFNPFLFYSGALVLICFIIPFLLFKLVKTGWVVLLYFMGVSLPHILIYGATFPQALVIVFLLTYFLFRKLDLGFFQRVIGWVLFAGLAGITHLSGFNLFLLVGFIEVVYFVLKANAKIIKTYLAGFAVMAPSRLNTLPDLIVFFLTHINPLVFFFALKSREGFYLILGAASLLFAVNDLRIASVLQICFILSASPEISKLSRRKKGLIIFLLSLSLTWYLADLALGSYKLAFFG